ncbi:MAG: HAD family phosphatase [Desulfobacterales bacterium]|nr:HAD family phosphatase [Desulfobacterales bacterium]
MKIDRSKPCSVDVILFDFGGVLAEEGFQDGLREIAQLHDHEPEAFIKTGFDVVYQTGYVIGRSNEASFWQALRVGTGIRGDDESLRRIILRHFVLRPWMMDLVAELKRAKIRLGILSDLTNWLDELDALYGFFKSFDYVFNSYRTGKSKRDPSLFDEILVLMDTEAGKVLFVDDYHGNIERAKDRGLQGILYKTPEAFFDELRRFCPFISA